MAIFLSKPYGYSRMEMEDAEERNHRCAQFLIYKTLEKSDSSKRRPSWLRVRVSKLKIKVGRRMKRLRKSLFLSMSAAPKGGGAGGVLHQHVISQLTIWKRFFRVREAAVSLPPLFT